MRESTESISIFRLIAQSFALSLLRQLFDSLGSVADYNKSLSVILVVRHLASLNRLDRVTQCAVLSAVSFSLNRSLSFAQKYRMSMGVRHAHIRESVESISVFFCLLQLRRVLPFCLCTNSRLIAARPSRFSVYPRSSKSMLSSPNYLSKL
jgi:hypothetical protein